MRTHNRWLAFPWFSVWFRYIAWWMALASGRVRCWLVSGWGRWLLLFTAVILGAWLRAGLIRSPLPLSEMLTAGFALKVLGAAVLLAIFFNAYRARSRMVILPFSSFTGDEKLKAQVEGLAARLLDELASLTELCRDADEAQPAKTMSNGAINASIGTGEIDPALREAVSADSKVKFGPLELPIGAILGLVTRILQGPRLSGSLHGEGGKLHLIVKIDGRGPARSWRVSSDDVEEFSAAGELEALPQMSKQMAYRVFTDLVPVGSARWRAVRCYLEGLRLYRETLRTKKDSELKLRRAEKKFIAALSHDSGFPYGHYNLGLVYRDLLEEDSARAAFALAIKVDPSLAKAYYALAVSHWNKEDYSDALRFCERVITLQPDDARAWNLKGLSERRLAGKDREAWKGSARSRDLGVALAWRGLCSAALAGRAIESRQRIAPNCLRNAAVAHAVLRHRRYLAIFRQALCLAPSDPELHFEMGKVLLDRGNLREGIESLTRAVRIEERPVFWAYLAGAYAKQFQRTKQDQYKQNAQDACQRAMDEASGANSETRREVQEAYGVVGEKLLADRVNCVEPVLNGQAIEPAILENWGWASAQRAIKLANNYLESVPPKASEASEQLTEAIKQLEPDHSGEIRRLGLYALLARAHRLQNHLDHALRDAKKAVALDPETAWVRSELGAAHYALDDWERAKAHWMTCLDLEPDDSTTLQNIAKAYWLSGAAMRCPEQRQRAFASVVDLLGQALEIEKSFDARAWMHYWLGRFHGELTHYDQATYHLTIARAAGFKPLECRVALGGVYAEIGAYYDAEQNLREAAREAWKLSRKIEPSLRATAPAKAPGEELPLNELLVEAYQCLAFSCAERGVDLERALRLTRYAARRIALAQKKGRPVREWCCKQHDCLGWIHVRAGDAQKGIAELEKALALGVDGVGYGSVHYHLARAYLARAEAAPGDVARSLAKVRECCANARTADLRGQYAPLVADILIQVSARENQATK